MKNAIVMTAALGLMMAGLACKSSDGGAGGSGGGTGGATSSTTSSTSTSGAAMPPDASCVKAGGKGNDIGVGEFCTPGGGECSGFSKAGLCLADVGQDQWFCTRIGCKADADCGMAAHCHMDPAGAGCVPDACEPPTSSSSSGAGGGGTGTGGGGTGGKG